MTSTSLPPVPQQILVPETGESSSNGARGRGGGGCLISAGQACCSGASERMISGSLAHVSGEPQLPPCWL